jgi:pimeloyl-ACP methyl ester carboxylesterase
MPVTKANGIDIYYELTGQGEPLVLIGGLGADSTVFRPVARGLAEHFTVLSFDNRGAGRSAKPDVPYSVEMMAADTIELMDALDIERAHFVGLSLGASIAVAAALDHRGRVEDLVLVSASARKTMDLRISTPFRLIRLLGRVVPAARGKYPQPAYAFGRQLVASRSYDCTSRLGEIGVRTLIMHGRKDRTVPLDLAAELHAGIRGSQFVTFRGGHSFFLFGERDRFLRETVRFLTRDRTGRPT